MENAKVPQHRSFSPWVEEKSLGGRGRSSEGWLPLREPWKSEPHFPLSDLAGQTQRWLQGRLGHIRPLIRPGVRIFLFGTVLGLLSVLDEEPSTSAPTALPETFETTASGTWGAWRTSSPPLLCQGSKASFQRAASRERRLPQSGGQGVSKRMSGVWGAMPSNKPPRLGAESLPTSQASARPRVLLISWDGAKPSVLRSLIKEGELPSLGRLAREGLASWKAQTILPSKTLPSHTSMVTGLEPKTHGITWNLYLPWRGVVKHPTIFTYARKAGLKTVFLASKQKFRHLMKREEIDVQEIAWTSALGVFQAFVKILEKNDFDLGMIHFSDPDQAGHRWGWGNAEARPPKPPSQAYLRALRDTDRATGMLLTHLRASSRWKDTWVILTSDHGGHERNHGSASWQDVEIPWIVSGGRLPRSCRLKPQIRTTDTPVTILRLLGLPRPSTMEGRMALLDCVLPR